jgi:16S rRNA (guanine966-N2)-methyltransferase
MRGKRFRPRDRSRKGGRTRTVSRPDRDRAPRILAGRFRGRALLVPEGRVTRPVRALVRRSLFDSLQAEIAGSRWLDLFAGSGSFGIEALSRDAAHTTFVEAGREGIRCLRENLARLGLAPPQALLVTERLPDLLLRPPPAGAGSHDFVALDPPFPLMRDGNLRAQLVAALAAAGGLGWFAPGCELLWEEPVEVADPVPAGFVLESRRDHGVSRVRRMRFSG